MAVRNPDITRKAILNAALRMFSERGFHGTNVPDLAGEAGVGAGTIYRHFANKEDLVNEVYQEWKDRFKKSILNPMPDPQLGFREQFLELWARLWRFYRKSPEAMVFLDVHSHGDYLSPQSRALAEEFENELIQWIHFGQQNGVLAALEPELMISMVYGAFIGLIKRDQMAGPLSSLVPEASGLRAWELIAS